MRTTEFRRGTNDCGAILADYVQVLTGRDPMSAWRGAYDDDESAEAVMSREGGVGAMTRQGMGSIGIEPAPGQAQRGDVVVIDYHGEEVLGLCTGSYCAFKTERGCRQSRFATILEVYRCV